MGLRMGVQLFGKHKRALCLEGSKRNHLALKNPLLYPIRQAICSCLNCLCMSAVSIMSIIAIYSTTGTILEKICSKAASIFRMFRTFIY